MTGLTEWIRNDPWNLAHVVWLGFFIWWVVVFLRRRRGRYSDRELPGGKFRLWKFYDKQDRDNRK